MASSIGPICPRLCTLLLAFCLTLGAGCDRVASLRGKKAPPPPPEPVSVVPEEPPAPVLTAEQVEALVNERLPLLLAREPRFNQAAMIKRLARERLGVDLDQLVPGGYDPAKLPSPAAVKAEIAARLEAALDEQFPPARKQQLEVQALTAHPLLKVGDEIKFTLRNNNKYSGKILANDGHKVTIGVWSGPISDLKEPPPSSFVLAEVEKARAHFMRVQYEVPRDDLRMKIEKQIADSTLKDMGFLHREGRWQRIDEVLAREIEPVVKQEAEAYHADVEQRLRERLAQEIRALAREGKISPPAPATLPDTPPPSTP